MSAGPSPGIRPGPPYLRRPVLCSKSALHPDTTEVTESRKTLYLAFCKNPRCAAV